MAQTPPTWDEKRTRHFLLLVEPTSYAAKTIDAIAARAEAAYERIWEWFGRGIPPTITVCLAGWRGDESQPGWTSEEIGPHTIWQLVNPESPALDLERAILVCLTRSTAGSVPPHALGFLRALAGFVASEQAAGLSVDEADRDVYEGHAPGSPRPRLFDEGDPAGPDTATSAEISFLSYIQRKYGREALARFVGGVLTQQPPTAARVAYDRPLEALEDDWLTSLRKRRRTATTGRDVFRHVFPVLRPHWLRVVELLGYMAIDLAFGVALPLSTKYLFDNVIPQHHFTELIVWLVGILFVFGVWSLASYRRLVVGGLIGELVLLDLRRAAFAHLQRLSLRFYRRSSTGDLLSRITNDIDSVQGVFGELLPQLLFEVIGLVVGAIVLLLLNWMLGLGVLLLGVPILAVVYIRASESLRQTSRELQERIGAMTAFVQENLAAQMLVKTFSLERRAILSFEEFLAQLFQSGMRIIGIGAILGGSTGIVYFVVQVAVLGAGAALIMADRMSVGTLIAFLGLIGKVLGPAVSISGHYQRLESATGAFDRIREVMEQAPEVVEDPRALDLPDLQNGIHLDRVSFRYDDQNAALTNVTLTIPAGTRAAVVGPSGAGKSTLVTLLLRLYDPTGGRILFDGRDIRDATLFSLRRQLAVVPQETYLFNASIRENIALGREDASNTDVVKAAEAAALHQVIKRTTAGYQSVIGEHGARLSGGERQRLAVARALIRNPRVLILDEATSALDAQTEAAILNTLDKVARGRTVVMITHRLTAAARFDKIFVLDQGRLVEQGAHDELVEAGGVYQRLYEEQIGYVGGGRLRRLGVEAVRLRAIPLFAGVGPDALALLAEQLMLERYAAGEYVVRQGEPSAKLYIIDRGEVEVLVNVGHRQRRVNILGQGDYFGEMALQGDRSRTATVRTTTPARFYSLTRADFASLLEHEPSIRQIVLETVAERRAVLAAVVSTEGRPVVAASDPGTP